MAGRQVKRLRVRELMGLDRLMAARRASRWGFPREIDPAELVLGHWFEWGKTGLFWLTPDATCEEGELGVHVAVEPGARLSLRAEEWHATLLVIGDLLGLSGITASPKPGTLQADRLVPILRALGWTRRGPRWYLSLAGGRGWEARAARGGRSARRPSRRPRSGRGPVRRS